MHVFLDTNILYDKFKLDNSVIRGLRTYLQLTKSKAYLSAVSFKEIVFKYKEKLKDLKIEALEKDFNNLNYQKKHDFGGLYEKIEKLVDEYEEFLKAQLKWRCEIVKIDESFMEECIDRAVCKRPPCGKKEEFRDTVIWLTYAKMINEGVKPIAFITNNTKDFWKELNPILLNDITEVKRKNMVYRNSLEQFLEEYYDSVKWLVDCNYIQEKLLTRDFCINLFRKESDNINILDHVYYHDEFTCKRTSRIDNIGLSWLYIKWKYPVKEKEVYLISVTISYMSFLHVSLSDSSETYDVGGREYIEVELELEKWTKEIRFKRVTNHELEPLDMDRLLEQIEFDEKMEGSYCDQSNENPDIDNGSLPDWFPFK